MSETPEERIRNLYSPNDIAEMTRNAVNFATKSGATQVVVSEAGEIRDASNEHFGLKDDGAVLDAQD